MHYILNCEVFNEERKKFLPSIKNDKSLDTFINLLKSNNISILRGLAKFLNILFGVFEQNQKFLEFLNEIRNSLIKQPKTNQSFLFLLKFKSHQNYIYFFSLLVEICQNLTIYCIFSFCLYKYYQIFRIIFQQQLKIHIRIVLIAPNSHRCGRELNSVMLVLYVIYS